MKPLYDYFDTFRDRLIGRLTDHCQDLITVNIKECPHSETTIKTQLTFKTPRLMITPRLQKNG